MQTKAKICCIKSVEAVEAAIALGASALGLVSAMASGPGVLDEQFGIDFCSNVRTDDSLDLQKLGAFSPQYPKCQTSRWTATTNPIRTSQNGSFS